MNDRRKHAPWLAAIWLVALGVIAASAWGANGPAPSELAPIHDPYAPKISPSDFVKTVDNPLLPFKPGTAFRYDGVRGKAPQTDVEVVTHQTKMILGIGCTVVRDTVSQGGRPIERTFDWYAQDRQGNVWYMGELSLERRHGHFAKASDSWESGVAGARPGIIMPAHPNRGDRYRQEYFPAGEALDEANVLGHDATVTVPFGIFSHALVTSEFSPIEPQTERKYYAAGVGEIAERVVIGEHEEFRLVSVTHG
jgi:hypothetical protein